MEQQKMLEACRVAAGAAADKFGTDIKILDIAEKTVISDYFVLATARNMNQLKSMADAIEEKLGEMGYRATSVEGYQNTGWVLIDYGFLIVHLFGANEREYYNLDKIWAEAVEISIER